MIEVELKSVVDNWDLRRSLVERAGGRLTVAGRLLDRRYDTPDRTLSGRDHVLRLRTYETAEGAHAELDWKGPTKKTGGYKRREELGVPIGDAATLATMLERLGYQVTTTIDREIAQYELHGTTVRFERYPRLDDLVEVEGTPEGIEQAIAAMEMPRDGFTTDRLTDFVARYEARTGRRAAINAMQLSTPGNG